MSGRLALLGCLLSCTLAVAVPSTAVPTAAPSAVPAATAIPGQTASPIATPSSVATPVPTTAPLAKPLNLTAQAYRARLQSELESLKRLEKRQPRPVKAILQRLDTTITVRRADGQVQQVKGNAFSDLSKDIPNQNNATKAEVSQVKNLVSSQLRALDEWLVKPPYRPIDGKKIVTSLEQSGQIRTGPVWWQQALANGWKAIAAAWKSFVDWLGSLMPSAPTPRWNGTSSDAWLWPLFYIFVAAILAGVLWFIWRTFGVQWSRRTVKRDLILQGEDAQLLLLPPEELRSRAEIYASQGNYREALRHRYLALLLHLDARGVWRYDSNRTNWEHIAALRRRDSQGDLVTPLSALTRRFDRVRYGGAPCDNEQWQQFDADTRTFETQTAPFERTAGAAR